MRLLVGLAMGLCMMTGVALAQDAVPAAPVKEVWTTSEGTLTIASLPFSFQGVYDQDNGRMVGALTEGGTFVGYWGEDASSTECPTPMLGTKFWGRIAFTFDKDRKHFDGKWSYCDADPDSDWTGDIAK